MSYDVSLSIATGGDSTACIFDSNMTSNVAPMWRKAGADLAEMHGKTAAECAPVLAAAVLAMEMDPAGYKLMDPPNGWGDYEGCLDFLRSIRDACVRHPACVVEVSR